MIEIHLPSLIVGITGHRPSRLHSPGRSDGYDRRNPLRRWLCAQMRQLIGELDAVATLTPPQRSRIQNERLQTALSKITWQTSPSTSLLAVTGCALGVDQDFAGVCARLGVPYLAAVPYPGQESRWPPASQLVYADVLRHACGVVNVCELPLVNDAAVQRALLDRNAYICAICDELIAVYDGNPDGGTAHCIRLWRQLRGERGLHLVDPRAYCIK